MKNLIRIIFNFFTKKKHKKKYNRVVGGKYIYKQ